MRRWIRRNLLYWRDVLRYNKMAVHAKVCISATSISMVGTIIVGSVVAGGELVTF